MPFKTKELRAAYSKRYRSIKKQVIEKRKKLYWIWQRLTVLRHYAGSDKPICNCCKETTYQFLALDHIYGGGTQHREASGSKYIMSALISEGFPEGYQVLCHNCNQAKGFYGKCPHQWTKKERQNFENLLEEAAALQVKTRSRKTA